MTSSTTTPTGLLGYGILAIIIGALQMSPRFVSWWVPLSNKIGGVKTELTPLTFQWARIGGVVAIIFGITFIAVSLWLAND